MPFLQLQSLSHLKPIIPFHPHVKPLDFIPKLTRKNPRNAFSVLSCSATEQELLQAVLESDEKALPCVRAYETDLARLVLAGAVDLEQALTAAAADGGEAAAEHIDSGMPAMVVETVFPGPSDERSTVSTRLFLPAQRVKEKAKKLRRSIPEVMLTSTTSRNILSMTFRQVVLQQLWNFELVVFRPGSERNMEDLENPREVPESFSLTSSDERVISVLAEAVCLSALQSTEKHFLDNILGNLSSNFFRWFRKPKRIASKDSSVIIYQLFENDVVENAKTLLENFNSTKESFKTKKTESNHHWWLPLGYAELEKIGGPDFSAWTSEYVPAYRLQIDTDRLRNIKFKGWKNSAQNRWEVLLTHSQMVGLADTLDMYYEDIYSLPNKQLSCGLPANFANLSNKKRSSSLLKMLSVGLASGVFLVLISAFSQLGLPYLSRGRYPAEHRSLPSSEVDSALNLSLDARKLEEFCISIVEKIKDAFGWPGDIITETSIGAWTGELPSYLRMVGEADSNSEGNSVAPLNKIDEDMRISAQEIASYQVVLSSDGKIVGFQPLSRVAVNHWAANPLAKELYGGRKLSPGFIEPGPKVNHPNELVVMELLMSVNPDSCFALARPLR
ncbi:uncharacterized protein LOC132172155 isoform X2 [Corylus avellana]|uniref:uncharacterized protein LOC132172155 isoform X2 n=1 Tax=Corylus avellana TaxID=13451 RepID=UPI00286C5644|nr:uncharacterized protein LOC132172155 isoform X2 [Corylus avellana]